MRHKILKFIFRFFIGVITLVTVAALLAFGYIYFNREKIISEVKAALNKEVNGEIVSGNISFDILKNFPATSVQIQNVSIRDSLFSQHKMEMLHAENVYIRVNFRDLFSSKIQIENILLENGSVYLFEDTSGYSNFYMLKKNKNSNSKNISFTAGINKLSFKDFRFIYRIESRNKFFNVYISKLKCVFEKENQKDVIDLDLEGKIKFLSFNTKKGFYATNTTIGTHLKLNYESQKQLLTIPPSLIYLNDNSYDTKASFNFGETPNFDFEIKSNRVLFSEAASITTASIQRRLARYKFTMPVAFSVLVKGSLMPGSIPVVSAHLNTTGNKLTYKNYEFTRIGLIADFTNQNDTSKICSDENSTILIHDLKMEWKNIPLNSKLVTINDLKHPEVKCAVTSEFPLKTISHLIGGKVYNFSKGTGNVNFDFVAHPDSFNLNYTVNGIVEIKNGMALYGPRSMPFNNIYSRLKITGNDVVIEQLKCKSGSSNLVLSGTAPGLISYLNNQRKDAFLTWKISSNFINLEDFTYFLSKRKSGAAKKASDDAEENANKLDNFLNDCKIEMKVDVAKIIYKNFLATNVSGNITAINNEWILNQLQLNHADGVALLNGSVKEINTNQHQVTIATTLNQLNIKKVFKAFDNFSQTAVTEQNIDGSLYSNVRLQFMMNDKAVIKQSSIEGAVDLTINNGELKGFQPLGKLSKLIFPKRDFTDIKFSELTNIFTVHGSEINFERMKINSSVMEMYIEGSYFLDGKTDMQIQIPMANLKNRDWEEVSDDIADKGEKGMNVFIHAYTDEKGDLKFKYDPFKKIKSKGSGKFKKFLNNIKK